MAGNPANVNLWAEADVLIYPSPTLPAEDIPLTITDPFATAEGKWEFLGLLVGDSGIESSRQWDRKDIPAWGYGVILVASKDFKHTTKVSALEDNPATQKIIWPGSTETTIVVPQPLFAFFALEKRTAGGTKVRRAISKMPGRFWVEKDDDKEGDAVPRDVEVDVFPNAARELYAVQQTAAA